MVAASDPATNARFRPDENRGFRIDVPAASRTVVVRCTFEGPGVRKHVLVYHFAPTLVALGVALKGTWVLAAGCGGVPAGEPVVVHAPSDVPRPALLVTAWDSLASGTWAQLERYELTLSDTSVFLRFTRGPPGPETDAASVRVGR